MAKKKPKKTEKNPTNSPIPNIPDLKLTDEMKKKLDEIKKKLDKLKNKVLEKFEDYILGIALLPPPRMPKEELEKPENKDKIHTLILIDDSDSKKMSKAELKKKLVSIIGEMAKSVDKNIVPNVLLISELWESCYDGKTEWLEDISLSAPIYEKGMLSAIKIGQIHKNMVLKKFEKYIVCYVLAGSLVQGRATPESDIDVFIVIDDTDVKRMTRVELRDKLRAIILDMGFQAGEMTGIKNKLNVQIYILTDFWDFIKEANPIIFTFLRDGVPFYDRGIFMPWKQLLKMGKIKPSQEAIDIFMSSGEQVLKRIKYKLREIGIEDLFWATLTPSQAALMLHGETPPTPKETVELMREVFVKKEKILEEEYVKILEHNLKTRKDLEHGIKKEVSGKEVDRMLNDSEKYLKRLDRLFKQIQELKQKEDVLHAYETIVTIVRDILRFHNVERVKDSELYKKFREELVEKGYIGERFSRLLKEILEAGKKYKEKKLTKTEAQKYMNTFKELSKVLVEYLQRKRISEIERTKIRVKYGNKFGEVILFGNRAFIISDINAPQKEIETAEITKEGKFTNKKKSSYEEMEKELMADKLPPKTFIKEAMFEELKKIFGKNIEIMLNY